MKAAVYERYGPPDVLELRDVEKPVITDDAVLVRVRATSINAMDWYFLTGTPYAARLMTGLRRPKRPVLGVDFAGTVESVGGNVRRLRPGDQVFGAARGAFAEYVLAPADRAVLKPAGVSDEQAAASPLAGLTALQGLRDAAQVKPGQKVLVNGASGGVGTFAVQIARWLGAEVTGVCSTTKVDMVREIGAHHVIDYTREDFTRSDRRYDLLFDVAGGRTLSEYRRVLTPDARVILAGGPRKNRWVGPVLHFVRMRTAPAGGNRSVRAFLARVNTEDLAVIGTLLAEGRVKPVIDGSFELGEAAEAFRYFGSGLTKGKVVIRV